MDQSQSLPQRRSLTHSEIALAVKLRHDGLTQEQIGQRLNRDQTTISALLQQFEDTRLLATAKARNRAVDVLDAALEGSIRAAKKGRPEHALEVVDRLEVLTKRQTESGRGNQVTIVIGMPGAPAGPDPMITVSEVQVSRWKA
jgi:DNA-binding MarR family transcriptional regulator